jgi:thioredoxin 1
LVEVDNQDSLQEKLRKEELVAVYLYTPMCGTCQVASRMIDILEKIPTTYFYIKANLNYLPQFAEERGIESVPCLLLYRQGEEMERIYAFQSVPYLHERLQNISTNKKD